MKGGTIAVEHFDLKGSRFHACGAVLPKKVGESDSGANRFTDRKVLKKAA
jgi:hypothetical protein